MFYLGLRTCPFREVEVPNFASKVHLCHLVGRECLKYSLGERRVVGTNASSGSWVLGVP